MSPRSRRRVRAPALAVLAVLVAGCAALDGLPPLQLEHRPGAQPPAAGAPVWRPDIAPLPARPSPEPAFVADLDPTALLGLARADVAALLGPPRLLRRDPPAEMWQYRNEGCVLHLFLYPVPADTGYEVRHVELRGRAGAPVPARCYAGLIDAPGGAGGAG